MIGVGSMSGAILSGLLSAGIEVSLPIKAVTKSRESARALMERLSTDAVDATSVESDTRASKVAVRDADVVVLGVKPWMVREVIAEIAPELPETAIVVSVAAGVPTSEIEALLPKGQAVVRAMPNTPTSIGRGVTGVAGGSAVSHAELELVRGLFAAVGYAVVVPESQINAVAAVSGSGPAYLYLYAEEMIGAAERAGFSPEVALKMVQQTIVGAAELWTSSELKPSELRRRVTSPKGTTEQAVIELQAADWGSLFDRALAANVRRSEEIERGE